MDLDGNPIYEGDEVISQRYDMGKCTVELEDIQFFYVSQDSGQKISYVKMVDAITGRQKVNKVKLEDQEKRAKDEKQ